MKNYWRVGLTEGRGGLFGLLDVLAQVGHKLLCSRDPYRALVAKIFQWAAAHTGTIGGPARTCVGLIYRWL